jgi:hypothetical protein
MPALANNRLAKQLQRATVAQAYNDAGTLLVDTITSLDAYGQPNVTTASTALACAFTDTPSAEAWKDFADIEQINAEVRFGSSATPARGNRFTVTKRFGDTAFTDATYEIVGIRDRGAFGYVCALKKVQI